MPSPPVEVLEKLVQQKVTLRLKDSRVLAGRLIGCDEHMNLVLDETEETTKESSRRLGRVVLRGSNVLTLNAPANAPRAP